VLLEIMTDAVVGRGEQTLTWCHKVAAPEVTQILGVRIGDVATAVRTDRGLPLAELTVDADLWVQSPSGTKVLRTRCRTVHEVPVSLRKTAQGEPSYELSLIGGPSTTGIRTEGDAVYVDFEAAVAVTATGPARYWVKAYQEAEPAAAPGVH